MMEPPLEADSHTKSAERDHRETVRGQNLKGAILY